MNKTYMNLHYDILYRFEFFSWCEYIQIKLLDVFELDTNKSYYLLKINDDYEIKYNSLEKAKKEFLNCVNNLLNKEEK